MRKLLLVLTMLCLSILVFSQAKKYVYAKAEYNSKRYCIIHCNYDDGKGTPIMNEKGDILKFRTDIEFINYLANEGWEFVLRDSTGYYYYFKKPQSEFTEEELSDIIRTRNTNKEKRTNNLRD